MSRSISDYRSGEHGSSYEKLGFVIAVYDIFPDKKNTNEMGQRLTYLSVPWSFK